MTKKNQAGISPRVVLWTLWPVMIIALAVVAFLRISLAGPDVMFLIGLGVMAVIVTIGFAAVLRSERRRGEALRSLAKVLDAIAEEQAEPPARLDLGAAGVIGHLEDVANGLLNAAAQRNRERQRRLENARDLAEQLQASDESMGAAVSQMSRQLSELSRLSNETTDMQSHSATAMDRLARTVEQLRERARQYESAFNTLRDRIDELDQSICEDRNDLADLHRRNAQVIRLAGSVSDLAEEANLVSLNTAVEAARGSGESNGAWTTIANEVRELACHSDETTGELLHSLHDLNQLMGTLARRSNAGTRAVGNEMASLRGSVDKLVELAEAFEAQTALLAQSTKRHHEQLVATDRLTTTISMTMTNLEKELRTATDLHERLGAESAELRETPADRNL